MEQRLGLRVVKRAGLFRIFQPPGQCQIMKVHGLLTSLQEIFPEQLMGLR